MKDTTADTKDDSFDDFDLDAFLEKNDFLFDKDRSGSGATAHKGDGSARRPAAGGADPNSTMSYAALGEDYPEIPLVGKGGERPGPTARSASRPDGSGGQGSGRQGAPANTTSRLGGGGGRNSEQGDRQGGRQREPFSGPTSRLGGSGRQGAVATTTASRTGSSRTAAAASALAGSQSFQQAHYTDSSYYIRGGGGQHHILRSPLLLGSLAAIVVIGAVLLTVFLFNTYDDLVKDKADEDVVTLTSSETRAAIDSQLPILSNYLLGTVDGALASFTEAGWNVRADPRSSTGNPDGTAVGGRIIHFSPSADLAVLDRGYFEGGYDAYDFDELQRSFNGAWAFDVSQGNLGAYAQLEYVNFAAESLDAELEHLRAAQGLADGESVVDSQDNDSHGNTFIRGYSVVEGVTYYWELIGIAFGDYYSGQDRRTLPPTAVFVKCKLANYDFYGVGSASSAEDAGTGTTGTTGTDEADGEAEAESETPGTEGETPTT
ncbi:MAG: hypothetical protein LBL86_09485 [Coriobacteriales bacterium]|jgi:hypothetical protein|nr:hypothetical protein [Coriobacteriales bacterium]